jgi:hypothetical protein
MGRDVVVMLFKSIPQALFVEEFWKTMENISEFYVFV